MPRSTAVPDAIACRRARVAELRLRHLSMRAICTALADEGMVNPDTKAPYTAGVVAEDLKVLTREWRKTAATAIATLRGEELAELREIRRMAWEGNLLETVIRAIRLEMDLVGTPQPVQVDLMSGGQALSPPITEVVINLPCPADQPAPIDAVAMSRALAAANRLALPSGS